jgi:hypothetical protein
VLYLKKEHVTVGIPDEDTDITNESEVITIKAEINYKSHKYY